MQHAQSLAPSVDLDDVDESCSRARTRDGLRAEVAAAAARASTGSTSATSAAGAALACGSKGALRFGAHVEARPPPGHRNALSERALDARMLSRSSVLPTALAVLAALAALPALAALAALPLPVEHHDCFSFPLVRFRGTL
jgi:hypothetical protein